MSEFWSHDVRESDAALKAELDRSNSWLCRLFGHKYDPDIADYYGIARCERKWCNYESTNFETGIAQWCLWKISSFFREKASGIRAWTTCPSCKWHFGRHDPKNDHIPF